MARKGASGLRNGVWFTAGLAVFVVVCLIATYIGESVPSAVKLQQHTPVVRGGRVSGEKLTQARRSAMASVEEVASTFKAAELTEEGTQEAFSKQLQDLHTGRAVRIMQDTTGLVERPCAKNTKKHLNRNHGSTKCYYPAPPPTPPNNNSPNCSICVSGTTAYFDTYVKANTAVGTGACDDWTNAFYGTFLANDDPVVQEVGAALKAYYYSTASSVCSISQVTDVNNTAYGKYQIDQGPYCLDAQALGAGSDFAAILPTIEGVFSAKSVNSAGLATLNNVLSGIAAKYSATCPAAAHSGETLASGVAFATVYQVCGVFEHIPPSSVDLVTGCNATSA